MSTPPKTKETVNVITIAGDGFHVKEVPKQYVKRYNKDIPDSDLDFAVYVFNDYADGPVKLIHRHQYERLQRRGSERIEPAKAGKVRQKQSKKAYARALDP